MKIRLPINASSIGNTFYVTGDSGEEYTIHYRRDTHSHRKTWACNCRDFFERRLPVHDICKHIAFVQVKLLQKKFDRSFHEGVDIAPADLHIRGQY